MNWSVRTEVSSSNRVSPRDPPLTTLTRGHRQLQWLWLRLGCDWSAPAILACDWWSGAGVTSEPETPGSLTGCPEWDHNSWLPSSPGVTTLSDGQLSVYIKCGDFVCVALSGIHLMSIVKLANLLEWLILLLTSVFGCESNPMCQTNCTNFLCNWVPF